MTSTKARNSSPDVHGDELPAIIPDSVPKKRKLLPQSTKEIIILNRASVKNLEEEKAALKKLKFMKIQAKMNESLHLNETQKLGALVKKK